jgi:2-desacetyl-2-hydroxyethyl bacteriochlorophyllide A dehydrogenase
MRVALLESEEQLVLTQATMPSIQNADQVLVNVKTVGVCGSEVHAFHGTHPFRKAPVILGHEAAGQIVALGQAVTRFQVGERVVLDPQWTCGQCSYCLAGDINHCPTKKVLGTSVWPGAFGEYIIAPEASVFHLPDPLSYAQGSLIEPLSVAVHVARRAGLAAGESVAILGTGSIGGLLAGVSRALGANPILAVDIRQHCLDVACERLGASHPILLPKDNLVEKVKQITDDQGVDIVFLTADDSGLVNLAIDIAKRRGRMVLVALLTHAPLQCMAYPLIGKELHIIGSSMARHADVRTAIDLVSHGQVDVEAIATHLLPIEDAQRGLELADTKQDGAIKVILSFGT